MTPTSENDDPGIRKLDEVAETAQHGESEKTPLILGASVWLVTAAAVLFVLVLSVLAYHLA